jgi:hypothetical protein
MITRQELFCHGCDSYVQFNLDISISGNHHLDCPKCGHQHYRYVTNGVIEDGYRGNNPVYQVNNATWTSTSTWDTYNSSDTGTGGTSFLYDSWGSTTTGA